jgi:hypothetical protein
MCRKILPALSWKNRRQYRGWRGMCGVRRRRPNSSGERCPSYLPFLRWSSPTRYDVWSFHVKIRRLLAAMIVVLVFARGSVGAENVKHDRSAALLSDPESDLSSLKGHYNLEVAARLDARLYAQAYKRKAHGNNCLGIGLEHAVKHHLKGRAIDVYALAFDDACSAFFEK